MKIKDNIYSADWLATVDAVDWLRSDVDCRETAGILEIGSRVHSGISGLGLFGPFRCCRSDEIAQIQIDCVLFGGDRWGLKSDSSYCS